LITSKIKREKKYVTSSYFDDIKELRRSKFETDYRDLYRNSAFDISKLQRAYVVKEIELFRLGCFELNEWVSKQSNDNLANINTVYAGQDWTEIDAKEIIVKDTSEIADPDNLETDS